MKPGNSNKGGKRQKARPPVPPRRPRRRNVSGQIDPGFISGRQGTVPENGSNLVLSGWAKSAGTARPSNVAFPFFEMWVACTSQVQVPDQNNVLQTVVPKYTMPSSINRDVSIVIEPLQANLLPDTVNPPKVYAACVPGDRTDYYTAVKELYALDGVQMSSLPVPDHFKANVLQNTGDAAPPGSGFLAQQSATRIVAPGLYSVYQPDNTCGLPGADSEALAWVWRPASLPVNQAVLRREIWLLTTNDNLNLAYFRQVGSSGDTQQSVTWRFKWEMQNPPGVTANLFGSGAQGEESAITALRDWVFYSHPMAQIPGAGGNGPTRRTLKFLDLTSWAV